MTGEPPEEIRLRLPDDATRDRPASPARDGTGVPVRWCALLAVLLLGATAGAGALVRHRRDAIRTVTAVHYLHPAGVDVAGCPRGDNCVPLDSPGLPARLPGPLRGASLVAGSSLLDASTSQTIRTVEVLAAGRLSVTFVAQCVAGAASVPAREQLSPGVVTVVRPGRQPGCSVAVLADLPPGEPAPVAALRQLAADPDLQLGE